MSNINDDRIKRLHAAALLLIKGIESNLENDAPEGIFRISANKDLIDAKKQEIEQGIMEFAALTQIQRAALLKAVLRELQNQKLALLNEDLSKQLVQERKKLESAQAQGNFSEVTTAYNQNIKDLLKKSIFINEEITFHLLQMLNKVSTISSTKMNPSNLAIVVAPNLFSTLELTPQEQLALIAAQNSVVADLITHAGEINEPTLHLESTHYQYMSENESQGRFHAFSVQGDGLKDEFKNLKGDCLKSKILLSFKQDIEKINSLDDLEDRVQHIIANSPEYKVLARGQGFASRLFRLETSSVRAFHEMVEEQKRNIEFNNQVNTVFR